MILNEFSSSFISIYIYFRNVYSLCVKLMLRFRVDNKEFVTGLESRYLDVVLM